MVGKIIRDYMEGGAKRLTVPGFGTFIRREESGDVVFVDLLRKEDGKLNELVEDYGGYSEVDAMALIDRFIFETKNTIERTGSAAIEGFGTLKADGKGLYRFVHTPRSRHANETGHAVQESLFGTDKAEGGEVSSPREAKLSEAGAAMSASVGAAKPVTKPVDRPASRRPVHKPTTEKNRRPELRDKKRSNADNILIIAIVAAIVAVIAMVFAFSAGNMPFLSR